MNEIDPLHRAVSQQLPVVQRADSSQPCLLPLSLKSAEAVEEQTERLEQWCQALIEKVEKLDRIVYRLWRDLKALVNEEYHRKQAE